MPKLETVFKTLAKFTESNNEDYEILTKRSRQVKFRFVHFDIRAVISLRKDVVSVKTESIFNVPKDHPASYAIKESLADRDFYTKISPTEGLVLVLEFSIDKDDYVLANGRSLGPFFEELIPEMGGVIDAIRSIVIQKFPYLAGQNAVTVGDETIIIGAKQDQKTIYHVFSTVITKPIKHKFTSIFNEWIFGKTTSHDDDRLLPNFVLDGKTMKFLAPKDRLIEKKGNISRYETIGTEKVDLTPFFEFIKNLSERIQELPLKRNSLCHIILLNIRTILNDIALMGAAKGEPILMALNSDIRDHYNYASEHNVVSAITEQDVEEMAKWRKLIGNGILFGKYQERVMKARFAARSLERIPRTLGVEKRKVNRVGGGFSVYISPIEAQVCNLGKEASIELVEEGDEKYLIVKRLPG